MGSHDRRGQITFVCSRESDYFAGQYDGGSCHGLPRRLMGNRGVGDERNGVFELRGWMGNYDRVHRKVFDNFSRVGGDQTIFGGQCGEKAM